MVDNQTLPVPAQAFGFGLPAASAGYARFASSDDYIGDLLRVSGKDGRCYYGQQNTEIELPHTFAALLGLVQVGHSDWTTGKPVSAFVPLADENADIEATKHAIPTDESKWGFDPKTGQRVDPRKLSIKVPMVDFETGHLFTLSSSAASHVRAWRKCLRACLVCQRANPETTPNHVPLIQVNTKAVPAQGGTSEIFVLLLETTDWIHERTVISALGKTGSAIQFGIDNQEALNADLPKETLEQPAPKAKAAKAGPRL
jgi:hypothetical protein